MLTLSENLTIVSGIFGLLVILLIIYAYKTRNKKITYIAISSFIIELILVIILVLLKNHNRLVSYVEESIGNIIVWTVLGAIIAIFLLIDRVLKKKNIEILHITRPNLLISIIFLILGIAITIYFFIIMIIPRNGSLADLYILLLAFVFYGLSLVFYLISNKERI